MASIVNLTNDIMHTIKDDNNLIFNLINLLGGTIQYIKDINFSNNLVQLADVITLPSSITKDNFTKDNNKFDIKDLELILKDIPSLNLIIRAILLLMAASDNVKLKYKEGTSEKLLFEIMIFFFIIIIPHKTNHKLTYEEKQRIVQLLIMTHQVIKSSRLMEKVTNDVTNWFKTKKILACIIPCIIPSTKEDIIDNKFHNIQDKLSIAISNKLQSQ